MMAFKKLKTPESELGFEKLDFDQNYFEKNSKNRKKNKNRKLQLNIGMR